MESYKWVEMTSLELSPTHKHVLFIIPEFQLGFQNPKSYKLVFYKSIQKFHITCQATKLKNQDTLPYNLLWLMFSVPHRCLWLNMYSPTIGTYFGRLCNVEDVGPRSWKVSELLPTNDCCLVFSTSWPAAMCGVQPYAPIILLPSPAIRTKWKVKIK